MLMLAGLIAWAFQFTLIYGATSTLCSREWASGAILGIGSVQAIILTTTIAAFIATAIALAWSLRVHGRMRGEADTANGFMGHTGALINGLSLLVILWQGAPALILPACA
jgi:hypothetical protein